MSPLEQLRADQHEDDITTSDEALEAYLGGCSIHTVRRDLTPTTAIERRHLARARRSTT